MQREHDNGPGPGQTNSAFDVSRKLFTLVALFLRKSVGCAFRGSIEFYLETGGTHVTDGEIIGQRNDEKKPRELKEVRGETFPSSSFLSVVGDFEGSLRTFSFIAAVSKIMFEKLLGHHGAKNEMENWFEIFRADDSSRSFVGDIFALTLQVPVTDSRYGLTQTFRKVLLKPSIFCDFYAD